MAIKGRIVISLSSLFVEIHTEMLRKSFPTAYTITSPFSPTPIRTITAGKRTATEEITATCQWFVTVPTNTIGGVKRSTSCDTNMKEFGRTPKIQIRKRL